MKANSVIALDVGAKRIGVARADLGAGFAHPLTTLTNDENIWSSIRSVVEEERTDIIVVGLPRNLNGETTEQTRYCQKFADELAQNIDIDVIMQDEALTSHKAEEELVAKGKPFNKADVDALAATYILEDYISEIKRSK